MIHFNDSDPAMRYESLYRFAFDCERFDDPWESATQSNYVIFMEKDLSEGKASLYRILHKLIFDTYKDNPVSQKLIKVEKRINAIKTQEMAVAIIDDTIEIIEKIS